MNNEIESRKDATLKAMIDVEYLPSMPELDFSITETKIPLSNLAALGVAFKPLAGAIQAIGGTGGGSGIYFVNTMGKQMFSTSNGYIGSLKSAAGTVGGGQARMTALPCDPTMLFMAAALMNIEKKLDDIREVQQDILDFLEEKERALLQGNLNVLGDIMSNFKYNWDNATYKSNKHILVQQIKKEAEGSIILYRDQIAKKLKKRSLIHSDRDVKTTLKKVETQFSDYKLALYLYSYSSFLEVMLLGNFEEGYLDSVEERILEYASQYRTLYTDSYDLMETYSKTSVQAGVLAGLSIASKFMGETIAKIPVISNSRLDENLIEAGTKIGVHKEKRTTAALEEFSESSMRIVIPFVDNIRAVNALYNKPATYLFDSENVYVRRSAD